MSSFATSTETAAEPAKPIEYFRKDYKPAPYAIKQWFLDFKLDESVTTVIATATVEKQAAKWEDFVLDGEELELLQVIANNRVLEPNEYEYKEDKLRIFAHALPQCSESFKFQTIVNIHPNKNLALSGLYQSGKSSLLSTQCEAMGFRRITFSLDRPDVLSVYRVRLEANKAKYPILLSNGNKVEEGIIPNTEKHYSIWEDPFPKPSYLFALVAGDLAFITDSFTTQSGRAVALGIYSDKENADKLDHAMYSLKESMKWDERVFNLECDLDCYNVVATNDFNMGAMENKGLNIFNSAYVLADSKTATDLDYENILGVIGHEYFHNWTGNRVTVRDWFQLTLKEGLTVFRDQWFSSDMISNKAIKRIEDVKVLRSRQFTEDAGPMAHPIRPESYISMDNFYTMTVYEKGSEIVRMYKTLFGEKGFLDGMKVYISRNDGKAVTCDDFLQAMVDANPLDKHPQLPANFNPHQMQHWYSQAGTPVVTITQEYDDAKKTLVLKASQRTPTTPGVGQGEDDKKPVIVPLVTGLIHPETGEELAASRLLLLTEKEQTFVFENVPVKPVVSTLRDLSAPVVLNFEQSADELGVLMRYDTDAFNAWDAGQRYLRDVLLQVAKEIATATKEGKNVDAGTFIPEKLVQIMKGILLSALTQSKDYSLIAYSLQLPDEVTLANAMVAAQGFVDIDSLHIARNQLKQQIAGALEKDLKEVYGYLSNLPDALGQYQFTPAEVSRRTLRNTCLDYLSTFAAEGSEEAKRQEILTLVKGQFDTANCMTDKIAALRSLSSIPSSERNEALQKFFEDAQGNALVINKWFSIQAQGDYSTVLDDLKKLKSHPDFTLSNPNRARSLLSVFGNANLYHFHQISGAGYEFLTDNILEIDVMNPQVASRLISSSFAMWKQFDPVRKSLMKVQLQRIQAAPKLSPDSFEIVNRYLQE